jgi:hypothetical protein
MNRRKFLQQIIGAGLVFIILVGCGMLATPTLIPPTLTPVPPTEAQPDTPTPTSTPEPGPYSSGSLDIPQTYVVDLDRGVVLDSNHLAGGDIWFEAATATARYFSPYGGGSLSAPMGTLAPGLSGCQSANYSTNRIAIGDLPVGTYVCVHTDEGRYSQVRIESLVGPSPGTLSISFTTW